MVTVPVGYGDGVRRGLSNLGEVLIGGGRHPIAGTVSMDNITVDVGDAAVSVGDEVTLIGSQGEESITRRAGGGDAGHDQLRSHLRDLAEGAAPSVRWPGVSDRVGPQPRSGRGPDHGLAAGRPHPGRPRLRERQPEIRSRSARVDSEAGLGGRRGGQGRRPRTGDR